MPLVVVNYDTDVLRGFEIVPSLCLGEKMKAAIAEALSISNSPNGKLTVEDIEVIYREKRGEELFISDDSDEIERRRNSKALEVYVWAHDYPDRRATLVDRVAQIQGALRAMIPEGIHGFVWVLLSPTAFQTF